MFPSGEPGVSGDFWGSQEGCQGPSRPSGRNRGLPLRRRRGSGGLRPLVELCVEPGGLWDDARGWQCPFVLCLHPQGCLRRGVRASGHLLCLQAWKASTGRGGPCVPERWSSSSAPAERLLWPGRASPSASQLLAFSPGKEQAAGAAHQASLSSTNSRSSLRLMSIESVMPSSPVELPGMRGRGAGTRRAPGR